LIAAQRATGKTENAGFGLASTIRKAVIPAAGLGTRFLPATKCVPKELLAIAGKPLIQYAVEEAAASGIETVILVVSRDKHLVAEYFQRNLPLERALEHCGKPDHAALLRRLSDLAEIQTVCQESPLGLADAVRCARACVGSEPFAVILPDALIDAGVPCLRQLQLCYQNHPGCVVATQTVLPEEVGHYGILKLHALPEVAGNGRTWRVSSLIEKPQPGSVDSRFGIFGRYILEPEIFACIDRLAPGLGGELQLTDALQARATQAPLYAYHFEGQHYDAGSKLGFLQASIAYALKDPEIAGPLREYLAALDRRLQPAVPNSPSLR
jgi:UTP--glucose-1-phosphate uridylyltransferase